jgi:hypothetical protein
MRPASKPKQQRVVYAWYIFVMKTGSIERSIGTRLEEKGDFLEVYDQLALTLSVQKSEVIDQWQQDRRVTKVGEQRIKEARGRIASGS